MIRILLLDCSAELQERLEMQGFNVESGTMGYCTGIRKLPSQLYEKDIFIYNPTSIQLDPDVRSALSMHGYHGLSWAMKDKTPQFGVDALKVAIEDRGGTLVAFLNRLDRDDTKQRVFYEWILSVPTITSTHDKLLYRNTFSSGEDTKFKHLAPLISERPKVPVLLRLLRRPEKRWIDLFTNGAGHSLGAFIGCGRGAVLLLPRFESNDAVIETFLHSVMPEMYETQNRLALVDKFISPAEKNGLDEIQKIENLRKEIAANQGGARVRLETARRQKAQVLGSEPTAKRVLSYFDAARIHDKTALFYLYKIIEAIENKYGGEATAIQAVGVGKEWKSVKRLANESYGDARHAPKPSDILKEWTREEIKQAFGDTEAIAMAYFKTLF